jgi:hypothetical protein
MKNYILFILSVIILTACSNQSNTDKKQQNSITFSNDMENAATIIPGWINEKMVNEGIAHSGKFSNMMDETREYGYGFQEILSKINKNVPTKIIVKAWIYSTVPNPDASFVAQIAEGGKAIWWNSAELKGRLPNANEWTQLTFVFNVDKQVFPTSEVRIFMWNQNKLKFYIDDMDVTFEY